MLKIHSTGTRFQWFAIDPQGNKFSGTAGALIPLTTGSMSKRLISFHEINPASGRRSYWMTNYRMASGFKQGVKVYEIWGKIK